MNIEKLLLAADGAFPNNPNLPLLLYQGAVDVVDPLMEFQYAFGDHHWGRCWINGVFDYPHFHSTAHEALGICQGEAKIQFGGPNGPVLDVAAGDLAILPAGTAHQLISSSSLFLVVGAYPDNADDYDLLRGEPAERAAAEQRIAEVPLPKADPVGGPLLKHW